VIVKKGMALLSVVVLVSVMSVCQAQETKKGKLEKGMDEQTNSFEMLTKEDTSGNSSVCPESRKDSTRWMDRLFSPIIKYSPADVEVPYTILPDALQSWKNFKKQMEEKYGTSIGITLDDHHQHILNGPGARKGRNIFWWNLTVKQELWEGGRLIFKARGSTTDGNPPHGITPLVGTKLNLDWAAYETELFYVANVYLEQKLLNDKLLIAIGKLSFPDYFDENKVA
jgi:hypothetical protein